MRICIVLAHERFQRFKAVPHHYETELPRAFRTWRARENADDPIGAFHKGYCGIAEELSKLFFLTRSCNNLKNAHYHVRLLPCQLA